MLSALRTMLERRLGLAVRRLPVAGSPAHILRTLFERSSVDCVVDVGAHHGQFGELIRRDVGFGGTLVSFEPYPASVDVLRNKAASDRSWHVYSQALSDQAGESDLITYAGSDFNSLHEVNELGRERFGNQVDQGGRITVEVVRLDDVYDPRWGQRLFVKSDTQGNDLKVLAGASGIDSIQGVQVEAGPVPIYDNAPSLTETVDQLQHIGFMPCAFHPVSRFHDGVSVVEFDVVFARTR